MRSVDTNVLVRLVTRDDEKQVASAEEFSARGAWVSHLVLAETSWLLSAVYDLDHREIATAIEMLLSQESVTVQEAEVVASALAHYRRKPSLGFSDCLLLEIARKAGHVPLGTFDKGLSSLPDTQRL
jgi:predicted nucleic-acid-binding protein